MYKRQLSYKEVNTAYSSTVAAAVATNAPRPCLAAVYFVEEDTICLRCFPVDRKPRHIYVRTHRAYPFTAYLPVLRNRKRPQESGHKECSPVYISGREAAAAAAEAAAAATTTTIALLCSHHASENATLYICTRLPEPSDHIKESHRQAHGDGKQLVATTSRFAFEGFGPVKTQQVDVCRRL